MYRVNVYDLKNGDFLTSFIPSACSWQQSWNQAGSMNVTMRLDYDGEDWNSLLVEQLTALALTDGENIIHAGPILEAPEWSPDSRELKISVGGGWNLLDNRLILDSLLKDRRLDGEVVIDEDNPGSEWMVAYQGVVGDVCASLIKLTSLWSPILIDPMSRTGITTDTTWQWNGWEFTTISEALDDMTKSESGQLRFDPYFTVDGRLRWRERWASVQLGTEVLKLNAMIPGQRVVFSGVSATGTSLVNEVWASGGKSNDVMKLYRLNVDDGTGILLQAADTSQSSSNSMSAIHASAKATIAASRKDRTWNLKVGIEHNLHVGDRVDLTVCDPYFHSMQNGKITPLTVPLIITDVSGDVSSDWLTVSAMESSDTVDGVRSNVSDVSMVIAQRLADMNKRVKRLEMPTRSQAYQVVNKLSGLIGG